MEYKLSDLVNLKYGKSQKNVVNDNGKYPILGTGGVIGYATKSLYDKPSVLIGRKGSIQNIYYVDKPFWTIDTLFYTEINIDKVIPKFLYYLFKTVDFMQYDEGTTIPSLRTQTLNEIMFNVPSLPVQRVITECLNSFDQKIEINNNIISNLEEQAQAIFKSWFVDFESFQDGEFVESELGLIPEGWEVKHFGEELDLFTGFPFKSKTYVKKGNYKVITIKNIEDGSLNLSSVNEIVTTPAKFPKEAILLIGDIVFTMTGNVGRVTLIDQDNLLQNQRIGKIVLQRKKQSSFYYFMLRNDSYKNMLINLAYGTAQANLSKREFLNILFPFNIEEINRFSVVTEPFVNLIIYLKQQNQKLAEIRDTLLPKLMSGEIDVSGIKIDNEDDNYE